VNINQINQDFVYNLSSAKCFGYKCHLQSEYEIIKEIYVKVPWMLVT